MSETQQGQGDVVNLNIQDWLRKQVAHLRGIDSGSGDADWLTKAAEELDRLYDENHAIKLEVMGGEDVPGSASAVTVEDVCAEVARLRTLLSSSRGEQGWRTIGSAPKDGTHIIGNTQWGAREIWWHKDAYEGEYWTDEGDSEPEPTGWIPKPGDAPSAPGSVPTSLAGQVPDEPTDEMIHAGRCAISMFNPDDDYEQAKACWRAMASVAPQTPFTSRGSVAFDTRTLEEVAGLVDAEHVRFLPIDETGDRTDHVVAAVLAELSKRIRAMRSVPTSVAGQVSNPEEYRDTFSGIVQGGCEACGDCDDDENGECACDRIVNELIAATQRINEEASPQPTAVAGQVPDDAEHVAQLICDADAEAKSLLTHGECALAKCYLNAKQALCEIAYGTSGRGSRTDAAVMQTIAQRALGEICEQQSSPQPTAGGDA